MKEYHKHHAISEPKEDYEDRNRLYAMYVTWKPARSKMLTLLMKSLPFLRFDATLRLPGFAKCE